MGEIMYEHSGQAPWNRNQSDELEREPADADAEYCDICGSPWTGEHVCSVKALDMEIEYQRGLVHSPRNVAMGMDDASSDYVAWLREQRARASQGVLA